MGAARPWSGSLSGLRGRVQIQPTDTDPSTMAILLSLTAVLLLTSGLVKLRAMNRVGLGLGVLPLVEVLGALAMAGLALLPLSGPQGFWAASGALVLLLVSSVQVGLRLRERRREREESLGSRLEVFVKYLSASPPED